ncbi:AraC family transcriptional regulator [Phreatobacter stygius]|uniref:AraC family transcriptional regulator n=1 Tax=Phreatobacter stygius TaxID=1940610 RepID=A0A4D7AZD5_9HYPH|nr:AraC family transcriptional regulator [Phreatobacter stygius]QCI63090.1 AraC family transcriptional regulator [Phreatobacter stygius]
MTDRPKETTEFWRHPRFRDLGLLKARFRQHRYDRHTHPTYVIALITGGCERVSVGRVNLVAPAGTVLVVNPEEWHDGEAGADDGWAYRTFYPSLQLMTEVAGELGQHGPPLFAREVIADAGLARALALAHQGSTAAAAASAETSMLTALRQLILRHGQGDGRPEPVESSGSRRRLALYQEVIERNLAADLDLQRLALAAGVTRFQVIRDFKKVAGLTPAAFIRDRRLRHANHLIEQGASLAQAAAEAGFADQSHLSRTFRAMHGMTPGMFRKAG